MALVVSAWHASGQDAINREYAIKAAYLYNLGRYITWPEQEFRDARSPFVIGILAPEFVSDNLQRIAEAKTIGGRPLRVEKYASPEEIQRCQILFLPQGVEPQIQARVAARLREQHVLLVGESEDFLSRGGIVAFVIRDNNVRLVISLEAARRAGLRISSKLLQVAQTVN